MLSKLAGAAAVAASAGAASAFPVAIPLDPARSEVTVTLTIPLGSDSDTVPLDGFVVLDIDNIGSPQQLTLLNYEVNALETIDLDIVVLLLGGITADGRDVSFFYSRPGSPHGPVGVDAGAFLFEDVPTRASGELEYDASGVVCTAFQSGGYPCEDTLNLADLGEQLAESLGGEIVTSGRIVTITSSINVEIPLNPDDPLLGSLTIEGTLVGEITVPRCPGDLTGDGQTDVADFFAFLDAFAAGNLAVADIDLSGSIDVNDFFLYLDLFSVGCI